MRLVIERLVPSNAPEEELRAAADGLERYAEALKAHPRLKNFHGYAESANAGDVGAFFDQSPMIGLANPLAPPITIGQSGERSAIASVIFGFNMGTWFSVAMIGFAGGAILYDTSNVLHRFPEDRYVGAALELFASVALMFWYVLRLFISRD